MKKYMFPDINIHAANQGIYIYFTHLHSEPLGAHILFHFDVPTHNMFSETPFDEAAQEHSYLPREAKRAHGMFSLLFLVFCA